MAFSSGLWPTRDASFGDLMPLEMQPRPLHSRLPLVVTWLLSGCLSPRQAPPPDAGADGPPAAGAVDAPGAQYDLERGGLLIDGSPLAPDGGAPDRQSKDLPAANDAPVDGPAMESGPTGMVIERWRIPTVHQVVALTLDGLGRIAAGGTSSSDGEGNVGLGRYTMAGGQISYREYGGAGLQVLHNLRLAADGALVAAGAFEGAPTFDGLPAVSKGGRDAFVAFIAETGSVRRLVTFGGSGTDEAADAFATQNGGLFVTGPSGSFVIEERIVTGSPPGYVLAFEAGGALAWTRDGGGFRFLQAEPSERGLNVYGDELLTLDADSGRAYGQKPVAGLGVRDVTLSNGALLVVTGGVSAAVDLGLGRTLASTGVSDMYILALGQQGAVWVDVIAEGPGNDRGLAICASRDGHLYVGGSYEPAGASPAGARGLIAKYTEDGRRLWVRSVGSTSTVRALLCDAGGGVAAAVDGAILLIEP
jgi:hypothetical protein